MKKIISLLITVILLASGICPIISANAEAGALTKINAYDYDSAIDGLIIEGTHISFRTDHWTEYKFTAGESGMYTLTAGIGSSSLSKDSMKFSVSVNGADGVISYLPPTGDYGRIRNRHLGRFYLNSGENTIRITNKHTACYFDYITVEKRDSFKTDLSSVSAKDYIYGGNNGVNEENGKVNLVTGDWLVYDIEAEEGFYKLEFTAKNSGEKASGYISQNSISKGNFQINPSSEAFKKSLAFMKLDGGRSEFKIYLSEGDISLESFSLEKADEDTVNDFLNNVNNAKLPNEVKDALNTMGESVPGSLLYEDIIYERIIQKEYSKPEDIIYDFHNFYEEEKSSPTASAYLGKIKVDKIMSGNISFVIKGERIKKNTMVLAVIYKGNKLYKVAKEVNTGADFTISMGKIEVKSSENVRLKFFLWDSLDKLSPFTACSEIYEEIFVSPYGSADGDGTENNPFSTIKAAKEKAASISDGQKGDIAVNIEPGYYFLSETEVFEPEHSGKNGFNIIYRGTDDNEKPIISGGTEVSGWQEVSGGIYKAKASNVDDTRTFYIDGKPAIRARSEKTYKASAVSESTITVTDETFPSLNNPENAEVIFNISWSNKRVPVTEIEATGEANVISLESTAFAAALDNSSNIGVAAGKTFYVENDLSLLNKPGEFYFDKATSEIYYKPRYEGELLKKAYIPVTEGLVKIEGTSQEEKVHNIVFENLDFRYGAWNDTNNLGFVSIQADQYKDSEGIIKRLHAQFTINMADSIKIKNSGFGYFGSSAISLENSVTNTEILQNTIKDISGTAVVVGSWDRGIIGDEAKMCRNVEVTENVIRRTGLEYASSPAVTVYYENSVNISHNDISDVPYTGISIGWGWGVTDIAGTGNINVTDNKIEAVCQSDLWDGAHVYTLGPLRDSQVSGNYFGKSKQSNYGGVYTDSGSAYLNVFNNVAEGLEKWFFTGWYLTHDLKVYGNYSTTEEYVQRGSENYYEDAIFIESSDTSLSAYEILCNSGITYDADETELNALYLTDDTDEQFFSSKKFARSSDIKPTLFGDSLVLDSGKRVEYDVYAKKSAVYDICIITDSDSVAEVLYSVNNGEYHKASSVNKDGAKRFVMTAYLKAGRNTVSVNAEEGSLSSKWISFAENNNETIEPGLMEYTNSHSIQPEGSHISFHPGDWLQYDIVIAEGGWYNFYAKVSNPPSWGISVTVNDNETPDIEKTMESVAGANVSVLVGRIYLSEGENKVKIANCGGYYYFDGCIIKKIQTTLSEDVTEISATSYFVGYSAYGIGAQNSIHHDIKWEGGSLSFQPNDYADYIVYAAESGKYQLSIKMGCPSEMKTSVTLNDNQTFSSTNRTGKNDYSTMYFDICQLNLKEGKNIIRVKNTKGSRYFSAFKLTKLS